MKGTLVARDGAIVNAAIAERAAAAKPAAKAKPSNGAGAPMKPNGAAGKPKGGKA